jgi:hypothetical protein
MDDDTLKLKADVTCSLIYRLCSIPSFERKRETAVEQKWISKQPFQSMVLSSFPFGTENWYEDYFNRIASFLMRCDIPKDTLTLALLLILRFCKRYPLTLTNPQDTLYNVFVGSVMYAMKETERIELDHSYWNFLVEYQPHIRTKLGNSFAGLEQSGVPYAELERLISTRTKIHSDYNSLLLWIKHSLDLGELDHRYVHSDTIIFYHGVIVSVAYHQCYTVKDHKRGKIYPHQQLHTENRLSSMFHCCSIFFGLMNTLLQQIEPPLQVVILSLILMGKSRTIKSYHSGNGRAKANALYQLFVGALIHSYKLAGLVLPSMIWSKYTGFAVVDLNQIEQDFVLGLQGYCLDDSSARAFQNLFKQFFEYYCAVYEESLMRPETLALLQKSSMEYTSRFVREVNRQVFYVIYNIPVCFRRINIDAQDRLDPALGIPNNRKVILHFWSIGAAKARRAFLELVEYCNNDPSVTIISIQTDPKECGEELQDIYGSATVPPNLVCLDHLSNFQDLYAQAQMAPFTFCIILFQKKVLYVGPSFGSPFFDTLPAFPKLFPCTEKNWTSPCINETFRIADFVDEKTIYHSKSKPFDVKELHEIIVIRYWASSCEMSLKNWPIYLQDVQLNHGFMTFISVQILAQNHQTNYEENEKLVEHLDLNNVISIVDHNHKFKEFLFDCEFFFVPALIIIQKGKIVHVGCDRKEKCTFGHKVHCNC